MGGCRQSFELLQEGGGGLMIARAGIGRVGLHNRVGRFVVHVGR